MKKFNKYNKPIKKCSIEELCTSFIGIKRERWCSDEECVEMICEMIGLGLIDLDDMKWLLFYPDYCKVRKMYTIMNKNNE